jgi:hypothetical protein
MYRVCRSRVKRRRVRHHCPLMLLLSLLCFFIPKLLLLLFISQREREREIERDRQRKLWQGDVGSFGLLVSLFMDCLYIKANARNFLEDFILCILG